MIFRILHLLISIIFLILGFSLILTSEISLGGLVIALTAIQIVCVNAIDELREIGD